MHADCMHLSSLLKTIKINGSVECRWSQRPLNAPWPIFLYPTEYFTISNSVFNFNFYSSTFLDIRGCKGVSCPPIFSLYNLINVGWL